MARYHIILGNGEGCGENSSHETEQAAQERIERLNAHGHGPCRVWEEATVEDEAPAAEINHVRAAR